MRDLADAGFKILATGGTQRYLAEQGIACTKINKVLEGRPHIVDAMKNGGVQLVINTTDGAKAISDSRDIRRTALMAKVPYYTTIPGAIAAVEGIIAYRRATSPSARCRTISRPDQGRERQNTRKRGAANAPLLFVHQMTFNSLLRGSSSTRARFEKLLDRQKCRIDCVVAHIEMGDPAHFAIATAHPDPR